VTEGGVGETRDPISGGISRDWAAKGARFIVTQLRFCDLGLVNEDGYEIALKLAEMGGIKPEIEDDINKLRGS
jgi:hypothetical protein